MGAATGRGSTSSPLDLIRGLAGTLASAGRGSLAATLGTPGDLESLARMFIPGASDETFLPTTQRMAERLPQLPPALRQPTMEALGQFAPLSPSSAVKLSSNPAVFSLAAGLSGTPGALGMMGRRGAEARGLNVWKDILDKEFEAAAKAKRAGQDPRMKSNSGHPLAYTGFDLKPRVEQDISDFRVKPNLPDKPLPLDEAFQLPSWFSKAYPDIMDTHKAHITPSEFMGSGAYSPSEKLITIGANFSDLRPETQEALRNIPLLMTHRLTNVGAHELLGHGIQQSEGFTQGTSTARMQKLASFNPEAPLTKNLTLANFYRDLAESSDRPRIMEYYLREFPELSRDFKSTYQNLMSGAATPQALMGSSLHYEDSAKRLMPSLEDYETLNGLLNRGLVDYSPLDMLESAADYAKDKRLAPKALPWDKSYLLYRANAGENEANILSERRGLSLAEKKENPFLNENEMPPEFLHGVE